MKTGKYYLGTALIIGILSSAVFSEIEVPRRESKSVLLGQAEPALKGIRQIYIVIPDSDGEPNNHGLAYAELENPVRGKIEEAGIAITESDIDKLEPNSTAARMTKIAKRRIDPGNVKNLKFMQVRIPELRIDIDALDIKDSQQVVFRVQTSLSRLVYLGRENQPSLKTEVWQTEPVMQAVSAGDMAAAITSTVLEQVEAFTHAYLAANPAHKRFSDANDINTAAKEQAEPNSESTPEEYNFVASKNGKAFHKPDCLWVRRIKPENLVSYNSRDEAIDAGKNPCKQCNP